MKKTNYLVAGIVILVAIIGLVALSSKNKKAQPADSIAQTTQSSGYRGAVFAGKDSPLIDFNQSDYEQALKTDKLVLLYFYANWCPTCRTEVFDHLEPFFNELKSDNVIGFRVNFNDSDTIDTERELARQFGVPYQHTKVFLKNGERVLKSPESWDIERYKLEINKAIQ
ncbi:MAG: thioredoxin family protein [Patescibacteria group bacterium]